VRCVGVSHGLLIDGSVKGKTTRKGDGHRPKSSTKSVHRGTNQMRHYDALPTAYSEETVHP